MKRKTKVAPRQKPRSAPAEPPQPATAVDPDNSTAEQTPSDVNSLDAVEASPIESLHQAQREINEAGSIDRDQREAAEDSPPPHQAKE